MTNPMDNRELPPPLPPRRCPVSSLSLLPTKTTKTSSLQSSNTTISNVPVLSTLPVRSRIVNNETATKTSPPPPPLPPTSTIPNLHFNQHLIPPRLPPQLQVISSTTINTSNNSSRERHRSHHHHQQQQQHPVRRYPIGTTSSSLLSPTAVVANATSSFTSFSVTSSSSTSTSAIVNNRSLSSSTSNTPSTNTSTNTSASVSAVNLLVPRPQSERKLNDYTDTPLRPPTKKHDLENNDDDDDDGCSDDDSSDATSDVERTGPSLPLSSNTHRSTTNGDSSGHRNGTGNVRATVIVEKPRKNVQLQSKSHLLPTAATAVEKQLSLPEGAAARTAVELSIADEEEIAAASSRNKCSIICPECNRCRCDACEEPRQLPERLCCNGRLRFSLRSVLDTITCMCCANLIFYHCMNSSRLREYGSRSFEVRDDDDDDDYDDDYDNDGHDVVDSCQDNGNTDPNCCNARSSYCFRLCSCCCSSGGGGCSSKFVFCTCFRLPAQNRPNEPKRWDRNKCVQPLRSPHAKKFMDFGPVIVDQPKFNDSTVVVNVTDDDDDDDDDFEPKNCMHSGCHCSGGSSSSSSRRWWSKRRKRKKTIDSTPKPQKKRFSFKHVLCLGALAIPLPCLLCYWPLRSGVRLIERLYAHLNRTGCRCKTSSSSRRDMRLNKVTKTTPLPPQQSSINHKLKTEHS